MNEYGSIIRLVVKHARDAFRTQDDCDADWANLNFTEAPDLTRAIADYEVFLKLVSAEGATLEFLPPNARVGLDSIYVRDASIVTPRGVVLCHMGKPQRSTEPMAQADAFADFRIPVLGAIHAPGKIEGGDVVWFDDHTVAVGRGYRTNDEGIEQFQDLLGPDIDLLMVPLPHHRGPADVFHLMSIISPIAHDLAVVYSPLMPVVFREWLIAGDIDFVEVPDEEFDTMGANVLAIAPRRCVMVEGNPITRDRLEDAGATVAEYDGREISLKGGGGPTCLTRPIARRG